MFKRIFLFVLTNILVMVTVSLVLRLLGVGHYITSAGIDYYSLMVFCLIWGFVGSGISLLLSAVGRNSHRADFVSDSSNHRGMTYWDRNNQRGRLHSRSSGHIPSCPAHRTMLPSGTG